MKKLTVTGRLVDPDPEIRNIPIRTEIGDEIRQRLSVVREGALSDSDYSEIASNVSAILAVSPGMTVKEALYRYMYSAPGAQTHAAHPYGDEITCVESREGCIMESGRQKRLGAQSNGANWRIGDDL